MSGLRTFFQKKYFSTSSWPGFTTGYCGVSHEQLGESNIPFFKPTGQCTTRSSQHCHLKSNVYLLEWSLDQSSRWVVVWSCSGRLPEARKARWLHATRCSVRLYSDTSGWTRLGRIWLSLLTFYISRCKSSSAVSQAVSSVRGSGPRMNR